MAKMILAPATFAVALACAAPALAAEPAATAEPAAAAAPAKDAASATPAAAEKKADGASSAATVTAELASEKRAEGAAEETPGWQTALATRRGGFAMGITLNAAVGNITGYPNDLAKVGRAEYRADTGAAFGAGGTVWFGGALADWLVFGLGLGGSRLEGNGTVVQGFTFVFHTEVFPLFSLGGVWRDIGVSLDTGAGNMVGELSDKPSGAAGALVPAVIDSGAASRIGTGLFYDGFRAWKIAAAPFVAFDYTWSSTLQQPLLLVGLRTALYTKPKNK